MKDALAISEKRIWLVGLLGVIAGMAGAVMLGGSDGVGAALLAAGFALLITALNQAFTWERQKLQSEYDEDIKLLLTEIRDKDCCSNTNSP